ncbi:hypothetical protein EOPP23_18515 [Endozoicomonas sp. OPT23]|nr:hypothetical protein [Endozoicomonas sp. OPT23]
MLAASCATTFSCLAVPSWAADPVETILKVGEAKTNAAVKSQKKIDKLANETDALLQQYKTVNKQIDGLNVYNSRLQKQLDDQLQRLNDLDNSIAQVTVIQRQITPLTLRMIEGLEQFVKLDVPFLQEERQERIQFLKDNINRSDLTTAEKFRQVLEAYKIENEFGRKIESYEGKVDIDGAEREVKFLRVGRIALLYQTKDTQISGAWDQQNRRWVQLDNNEYRSTIQKSLRIARKQAAIDVLKLPVAAPEAVL